MTEKNFFGKTADGREVCTYKIENGTGAYVELTDFGARIRRIVVPDINGKFDDVTLGYEDVEAYEKNNGYFGAVVGRCANRLRNAEFTLNGKTYKLAANNLGVNTLHGGTCGFDKKVWSSELGDDYVRFTYVSPDMEEGFPGQLTAHVTYTFTRDNSLDILYEAECDKDTVVNLTNHAYFNLDGHKGEKASEQYLTLDADFYCPVNEYLQLTGEILSVKGTDYDFLKPRRIGLFADDSHPQIKIAGGYDQTFVLNKTERAEYCHCAKLYSAKSGRTMDVYTDQPGIQFYSGNNVSERQGKDGAVYTKRQGICLETHSFPDAMANTHFPSPILRAGEKYSRRTTYTFGVES